MAKPKTNIDPNVQDDWVDPSESGQNKLSFLKAEAGKVTRVRLMAKPYREYCSFIDEHKIGWVKTLTEFEIVNGKFREIKPGLDQITTGKPPEPRYIVPVIVYDVDKDGTSGVKPDKVSYSFMLWTMSMNIYERLFAQWKAWGTDLLEHDLLLTGVQKAKFTFFNDISVAKDAICLHPSVAEVVEADYANYKFGKTFKTLAGKILSEGELKKRLAGEKED